MVAPLRTTGEGTQQVTLALQPEGLGTVRATVTVSDGDVAVHLVADTPEGHQALSQSLPELRQQLAQEGGRVSVSLQSGGEQRAGGDKSRHGTGGADGAGHDDGAPESGEPSAPPTSASSPAQMVDLRL